MTVYDVLSTMKSRPRSHDSPEGLGAQGSRSFAIIRKKGVSVSVHVHCVCVCTPLCACVHTSVCVCVLEKPGDRTYMLPRKGDSLQDKPE